MLEFLYLGWETLWNVPHITLLFEISTCNRYWCQKFGVNFGLCRFRHGLAAGEWQECCGLLRQYGGWVSKHKRGDSLWVSADELFHKGDTVCTRCNRLQTDHHHGLIDAGNLLIAQHSSLFPHQIRIIQRLPCLPNYLPIPHGKQLILLLLYGGYSPKL